VNIDVNSASAIPSFQHTGWWYEYFTGDSLNVTNVNMSMILQPGEYRVYTDVSLPTPYITSVASIEELENPAFDVSVFPVPFAQQVTVRLTSNDFQPVEIQWFDAQGMLLDQLTSIAKGGENDFSFDAKGYSAGTYLVVVRLGNSISYKMVVK
jgi:hypothetical protein